jgi:bifunctional ADP-heptose synthase (sugar kinase/adenylyltransferase)
MLTEPVLERILTALPSQTIGVVGDLFLDRYLDIDDLLTEPSIETGLDAYQVTRVRSYPGAAGTVVNNLVALGVGRVIPVAVIGDDGEGYELRQALTALPGVYLGGLLVRSDRRTPTYTKPMLCTPSQPPRELHRLDIKNRTALPSSTQETLLFTLGDVWAQVDALIVVDQVSEAECGVVTTRLRERLADMARADPDKIVLADSRERIAAFRSVCAKPNERECRVALQGRSDGPPVSELARMMGRPVFCTMGQNGILVAEPAGEKPPARIPSYPVDGEIDIVGAGDATSAGIAVALAAGVSPQEAAAFGNLVASVTIQQVGVTGTATPEQLWERWAEVNS